MAQEIGAERRNLLKLGALGLAAASVLDPGRAAAAAAPQSLLRTVLDRGKLIVGTGSTNAPWHFEDANGKLTGMDIAMGKILAMGLFGSDDDAKIEFVQTDPAARIPNIMTGKVDIVIQFMTITSQRAQLVNFSRPYYVEGVALLTLPGSKWKNGDQLKAAGSHVRVSVLQNVGADALVHEVLPEAEVMQLDTQANVIQALESHRVDAAAVDLSTVKWMVRQDPHRYADPGVHWQHQLYGAAVRQSDFDWLQFVNTTFNVAMFGNDTAEYDAAFKEFFGDTPPPRHPGFPMI
ncbi:MAG TPA: transporter substrate-binding domain-containing protein [Acetobacteraceae bacterium]|jgi:polar amino acid transport system substrate-binding protein|nr:transporter substrate-binding domain-containing protein [Acetobacteraceae bacterium]